MAHGTQDQVVPLRLAEVSKSALERHGYRIEWETYPMPHAVCGEEIESVAGFLTEVFDAGGSGELRSSTILLPGR